MVWAEGNHALLVRCVDDKYKDWKLLSQELPSEEIKEKVLVEIEKHGFRRDLAWDITNKSQSGQDHACLDKKPTMQEVSIQTLEAFEALDSDDTPIHSKLDKPILWNGTSFINLNDFFKHLATAGPGSLAFFKHRF